MRGQFAVIHRKQLKVQPVFMGSSNGSCQFRALNLTLGHMSVDSLLAMTQHIKFVTLWLGTDGAGSCHRKGVELPESVPKYFVSSNSIERSFAHPCATVRVPYTYFRLACGLPVPKTVAGPLPCCSLPCWSPPSRSVPIFFSEWTYPQGSTAPCSLPVSWPVGLCMACQVAFSLAMAAQTVQMAGV